MTSPERTAVEMRGADRQSEAAPWSATHATSKAFLLADFEREYNAR